MLDMIEKLNVALFKDAMDNGTHPWNVFVQRALIIYPLSSTGARAGDIVRAAYYDGFECLIWGDVEIVFVRVTSSRAG